MNKNKIAWKVSVLAILAITALIGIQTAFGSGQVTINVKNPNPYDGNQSWFVYDKNPGEVIRDTATLKNFGDDPVSVKVYAVDATSSESGSFILTFLDDKQYGIGAWTELEISEVTLEPHEVLDVPFTITVPEKLTPGQYLGGIVIETGNPAPSEKGDINGDNSETSISIKTRVGSRVYLTIPGEVVEDIKLTDFTASKGISGITKFNLTIENNGNVAYDPVAHIEVYTQTGNLYETITEPLGTSSPNTVIKPKIEMKKSPLAGYFTAKATIEFPCKFMPTEMHHSPHTDSKETSFWAVPWEIILSSLFVIFIAFIFTMKRRAAKKQYFANAMQYTVQSNEDLVSIGTKTGTSWKKIAKYNSLKPPYIIKSGDKLSVPKIKNETKK